MKEGYWINISTGHVTEIDDHAKWIVNESNATSMGLSTKAYTQIKHLNWNTDRVEILMTVMNDGFIRVRGHGTSVTFEFTTDTEQALWAVWGFFKHKAPGPHTHLFISNLRTKESIELRYSEFVNHMTDDPKNILRLATKTQSFNYDIDGIVDKLVEKTCPYCGGDIGSEVHRCLICQQIVL